MKKLETFIESFKDAVRLVRIEPAVRDSVRERLVAYADLHAVREVAGRAKATAVETVSIWAQLHAHALRAGFAVFIALVGTSGIALASENTLPGDMLYPVKIGFVEPLETAMLVDAKSRATWNSILAERRLAEAAMLASNGALTEQNRILLQDQFELHVDRANSAASEVRTKGDIAGSLSVRSDLEARLVAHADIFGLMSNPEGIPEAPPNELGKLHRSIALKRDVVTAERMETEREASARMFAYSDSYIDAATAVTEDVARVALSTGGAVFVDIDNRITAARDALTIARSALSRQEDGGAFIATQTATRLAHEAAILNKNRNVLAQASDARARSKGIEAASMPIADAPADAAASSASGSAPAVMMMKAPLLDAPIGITATTSLDTSTSTEEEITEMPEKSSDAQKPSQETQESDNNEEKSSGSGSVNVQVGPVRVTVPSVLGF